MKTMTVWRTESHCGCLFILNIQNNLGRKIKKKMKILLSYEEQTNKPAKGAILNSLFADFRFCAQSEIAFHIML